MVLASPRLLGKIGPEIFSKVTPKACPCLVLDHGQDPGAMAPSLLCLAALGAAVDAAPFPFSCVSCVLGVSLMKPGSWQVMEGQALLCPCLSLRRHIFLTSYVNVCESEQSQGLQLPPPPLA